MNIQEARQISGADGALAQSLASLRAARAAKYAEIHDDAAFHCLGAYGYTLLEHREDIERAIAETGADLDTEATLELMTLAWAQYKMLPSKAATAIRSLVHACEYSSGSELAVTGLVKAFARLEAAGVWSNAGPTVAFILMICAAWGEDEALELFGDEDSGVG